MRICAKKLCVGIDTNQSTTFFQEKFNDYPLHWVLDVVFREDAAQAKAGFIAENMAFFRRLSMNIIKTADPGRGFADARRYCTYEPKYLRGILGKIFVG